MQLASVYIRKYYEAATCSTAFDYVVKRKYFFVGCCVDKWRFGVCVLNTPSN